MKKCQRGKMPGEQAALVWTIEYPSTGGIWSTLLSETDPEDASRALRLVLPFYPGARIREWKS